MEASNGCAVSVVEPVTTPTARLRQRLSSKLHRAGGALGAYLDAGDVVPDLDRQRKLGVGLGLVGREVEGGLAQRQALDVEPANDATRGRTLGGPQHLDAQGAGGILGASQRLRRRKPAINHRGRARAE